MAASVSIENHRRGVSEPRDALKRSSSSTSSSAGFIQRTPRGCMLVGGCSSSNSGPAVPQVCRWTGEPVRDGEDALAATLRRSRGSSRRADAPGDIRRSKRQTEPFSGVRVERAAPIVVGISRRMRSGQMTGMHAGLRFALDGEDGFEADALGRSRAGPIGDIVVWRLPSSTAWGPPTPPIRRSSSGTA